MTKLISCHPRILIPCKYALKVSKGEKNKNKGEMNTFSEK